METALCEEELRAKILIAGGFILAFLLGVGVGVGASGSGAEAPIARTAEQERVAELQEENAALRRDLAAALAELETTKATLEERQERPPAPSVSFDGDAGLLLVGSDIRPGTYRATCESDFGCYWARLKGTSGEFEDIVANEGRDPGQRATVTIRGSDVAFETTGFGEWTRVG